MIFIYPEQVKYVIISIDKDSNLMNDVSTEVTVVQIFQTGGENEETCDYSIVHSAYGLPP